MEGHFLFARRGDALCIRLVGVIKFPLSPAFEEFLDQVLKPGNFRNFIIDLTQTEYIDSTNLGLLARISCFMQEEYHTLPYIFSTNQDINTLLFSLGFDRVFRIIDEDTGREGHSGMRKIAPAEATKDSLTQTMLKAHRELMRMNEKNKQTFQDIVDLLEKKKGKISRGTGNLES